MKKEIFEENRRKLIFAIAVLSILILLYFCVTGFVKLRTNRNDVQVAAALTKISYTEDEAKSELKSLQPYTEWHYLSKQQRGQLYKTMAELSYMTGNDMEYNYYVASALTYLQYENDVDSIVYLYNKYLGRLYANGCYESAEALLQEMAQMNDISSLSLEMQASYYLSRADVAQIQDKDDADYLSNSQAAIRLMSDSGEKLLYQAKYDLLSARADIQNGNFDRAEERLSGYSVNDNFGLGEKQVYVICDFQIPYYEMMAKIYINKGELDRVYQYIDQYIKLCDFYEFRNMKLRLLQYVVNSTLSDKSDETDKYRELERAVTAQNLNELAEDYGRFLLSDIDATQDNLKEDQQQEEAFRNSMLLLIGLCYAAIVLYCGLSIFVDYMSRDGLTSLNSRKKYERIRRICEEKKIPYCFLIIDIDDFKKVNDTYGHDEGDRVLREISAILHRYVGRGISAYRYGGEELGLFFLRVPEKRARQIAEEIRAIIEKDVTAGDIHITVSGGIGVSHNGENVFQEADRQLYESKKNGKNQIR